MLNLINTDTLTVKQRKDILERALYSQPFLQYLPFEVIASSNKDFLYQAKANVDKDFWITEVVSNFGEVYAETASLFDLSLWTSNVGDSLFRWTKGLPLPTAFQASEARLVNNAIFDDKQRELMPRLVAKGNSIQANIVNLSTKEQAANAKIVLKGYYTDSGNALDNFTLQGINESLEKDSLFETWTIRVDFEGQRSILLNNDRFARLVLGFGIVNHSSDESKITNATVMITDNYRSLRLMSEAIPVEFFAPRLPLVIDVSKYYLPVEYLFKPNATLKFFIENTFQGAETSGGFDLVMFTRTV